MTMTLSRYGKDDAMQMIHVFTTPYTWEHLTMMNSSPTKFQLGPLIFKINVFSEALEVLVSR